MSRPRPALLQLAAALGTLGAAWCAQAQTYPPTDPPLIYTIPEEVRPNQPFQIAIETMILPGAVGADGVWVDTDAHIVYIAFDYFCGWPCPGPFQPYLGTFHVDVRGLAQGNYIIRFPSETPVDVPLRIGGPAPVAASTMDWSAAGVLVVLILSTAFFRIRPTLNGNGSRHG
jgi:hypothetical protein